MPAQYDNVFASAIDRFSFNLFAELVKRNPAQNIFVSPYGISLGLSLLANGTGGATRKAVADVLSMDNGDLDALNQHHAELFKHFQSHGNHMDLLINNALWLQQGYEYQPSFLNTSQSIYQAAANSLDLTAPDAPSRINEWAKQATHHKIPQLIDKIKPATVMILTSALYFRALWLDSFVKFVTKDEPFTLLDGTQKQHPMMRRRETYVYLRAENFKAVELLYLPYNVYRDVPAALSPSMLVFLPDEDSSLDDFLQELNYPNWLKWMSSFSRVPGKLGLPRFTCEYDTSLNDVLSSMGMAIAFDPNRADFSQMLTSSWPVFISETRHKTYLKVDESGTEATSLLEMSQLLTGMSQRRPMPEFEMICNRPFFFVIGDNVTGTILFMGTIVNPQ